MIQSKLHLAKIESCVLCNNNFNTSIERGNDTGEMFGIVYDWSVEFDFSYCTHMTKEQMTSFKCPIDIQGCYYGIYLSNIDLPKGVICPTCFIDLNTKNKIIHLWTH